jgi:hypothetical protein
MSAHEWSIAIERMLVRIEDTADGDYLFESLLGLAGRIDPLRL